MPDNRTTLACLIPLGMRSLMTSRMMSDPMKAYSAGKEYRQGMQERYRHASSKSHFLSAETHLLAFVFRFLSFSRPCRWLGGGVGAGPVPLQISLEQYGMNLQKRTHSPMNLRAVNHPTVTQTCDDRGSYTMFVLCQ